MTPAVRRMIYDKAVYRMQLFRRAQAVLLWYLLSLIPIIHLLDLHEADVPLFGTGIILLAVAHYRRLYWRKVACNHETQTHQN